MKYSILLPLTGSLLLFSQCAKKTATSSNQEIKDTVKKLATQQDAQLCALQTALADQGAALKGSIATQGEGLADLQAALAEQSQAHDQQLDTLQTTLAAQSKDLGERIATQGKKLTGLQTALAEQGQAHGQQLGTLQIALAEQSQAHGQQLGTLQTALVEQGKAHGQQLGTLQTELQAALAAQGAALKGSMATQGEGLADLQTELQTALVEQGKAHGQQLDTLQELQTALAAQGKALTGLQAELQTALADQITKQVQGLDKRIEEAQGQGIAALEMVTWDSMSRFKISICVVKAILVIREMESNKSAVDTIMSVLNGGESNGEEQPFSIQATASLMNLLQRKLTPGSIKETLNKVIGMQRQLLGTRIEQEIIGDVDGTLSSKVLSPDEAYTAEENFIIERICDTLECILSDWPEGIRAEQQDIGSLDTVLTESSTEDSDSASPTPTPTSTSGQHSSELPTNANAMWTPTRNNLTNPNTL